MQKEYLAPASFVERFDGVFSGVSLFFWRSYAFDFTILLCLYESNAIETVAFRSSKMAVYTVICIGNSYKWQTFSTLKCFK